MKSLSIVASNEMKRINVIGTSGSGKSTVAKQLSNALKLPHIEMDQIIWSKSWTMLEGEPLLNKLKSKLADDKWVLDGNYSKTVPVKWRDVQMVVWLDLPFILTLYQAISRSILRIIKGKEIWKGSECYETFRKSFFSRDSPILWTITSYRQIRLSYEKIMEDDDFSHIEFVRLRSRKEIDLFIKRLTK